MTRLGPPQVGLFLAQQADELVRIWRLARAAARQEVFPGLIDDLVGGFFARAGELLAGGAAPEEAWRGLEGLVRWPPDLAAAEIDAEWALVDEVVGAACESVNAAPEVAAWLARAVAACRAGTPQLATREGRPEAVVTALVFSSVEPPAGRGGASEDTVS